MLRRLIVLSCGLGWSLWVSASLSTTDLQPVADPGVVQLKCVEPNSPRIRYSLGGLLFTPANSTQDLVLVTAHGLQGDLSGCRVEWQQQSLSVVAAVRGEGVKVHGDWAVLTLNARFTGQPHRFTWRAVALDDFRDFAADKQQVFLLKHPGSPVGEGCAAHIPTRGLRDASDADTVLVADCLTIPGMSGAPVMVKVNETPVLVGLNVGQRFDLSHQALEWKRQANVIRLIDVGVERAIVLSMARLVQNP